MQLSEEQWLQELKAGDEVVVRRGYVYGDYRLGTVERTTPTLVIVSGLNYRRRDGYTQGSGYQRCQLIQPTQELRDKIETTELLNKFSGTGVFDKLPLDSLRQIDVILKAALAQSPDANDGAR